MRPPSETAPRTSARTVRDGNQNNYSMDGSSVVNYVSGTAAQNGSFPGIAIPNPDTIQEFKVQTSQYDASSGRNPGANVEVITKSGSNRFSRRRLGVQPQQLFQRRTTISTSGARPSRASQQAANIKQNTFGGTIGGPIKKDKLFFFWSPTRVIRQMNGIGTSGFASGYSPNTQLLPWNDPNPLRRLATCVTINGPACTGISTARLLGKSGCRSLRDIARQHGSGTSCLCLIIVAADGSNISNTAIGYLQAKGVDKGGL